LSVRGSVRQRDWFASFWGSGVKDDKIENMSVEQLKEYIRVAEAFELDSTWLKLMDELKRRARRASMDEERKGYEP
jgi:hypothetical protein